MSSRFFSNDARNVATNVLCNAAKRKKCISVVCCRRANIATIQYNDYFRWEGYGFVSGWGWGEVVLVRNNYTGALAWGMCNQPDILYHSQVFIPVYNFHLGTFTFQGMTVHQFQIQNRQTQLRKSNGDFIEWLSINTWVGIRPTIAAAVMGQNWCTYWRVVAVLRYLPQFGGVQWTWADMSGQAAGFLNTGLPYNRPNTSTIKTSLA